MNLQKIITIVVLVIGVVSLIMWIMILNGNEGMIDGMIHLGKILVYGAGALALLFSIKNIASDGAKMKKTLISLVAFLIVVAIGYGLAGGEAVSKDGVEMVSESGSRWAGAGLYAFYFLAVGAIAAMLLGGVKKMIK